MSDKDLFLRAVDGDKKAIDRILRQYTPLVHKIVNKYCWMAPAHSREDLVQEGLLGIVKAIRTFDPSRNVRPMTWIYPQVRGAVQGLARKENHNPKYPLSLEQSDWAKNLESSHIYEVPEDYSSGLIEELVLAGCGTLRSKRAQIVCDRFGLLGRKEMRPIDVAHKYGMTKQAVNSHLSRFSKNIQEKRPELHQFVR